MKGNYEKVIEKYIWLLIALVNAMPIFLNKFFPSMDAPAHLYNSNLIVHLIVDDLPKLEMFLEFNNYIVPNWLGHFVLAIGNFVLPAFLAEKLLLISYFILLPFAFRYLVKSFRGNIYLSYLIFPFTYTFMFGLGYFNFSISFILFFFTIGYLHRKEYEINRKTFFGLGGLLLLTVLSHIFSFVLVLGTLFFLIFTNNILQSRSNTPKKTIIIILKGFVLLSLSALPGIILISIFFLKHTGHDAFVETQRFPQLYKELIDIRPLIIYNYSTEEAFTRKLFYIICLSISLALFFRLFQVKSLKRSISITLSKVTFNLSDAFLALGLIMLLVYFLFPSFIANTGNVTNRFGLSFYFFILMWVAINLIQKKLGIALMILFISLHFPLVIFYNKVVKDLNKPIEALVMCAQHIQKDAIVYPVNLSSHWLHLHYSNYLGIDKPMVILDNYEASMKYFPLIWNWNEMPNLQWNDSINLNNFCYGWAAGMKEDEFVEIDYVLMYGEKELNKPCDSTFFQILANDYHVAFMDEGGYLKLYENKKLMPPKE